MIVLVVQHVRIAVSKLEGQSPVPADPNRPSILCPSFEGMEPVTGFVASRAAWQDDGAGSLLDREDIAAALVEQLEGAPAAAGNTGERVVGDHHGQAGFFHQQAVQVA